MEKIKEIDFPAFDNSQRKGWDGILTSDEAMAPWVPKGMSGWEFSCTQEPEPKAESDYQKRTAELSAEERKSITFIFVTPHNWTGKEKWKKEKQAQGEWQDVRVFDASNLEQWLEQSIPSQILFREFLHGSTQKATTLKQIWNEWDKVTKPELPKMLFSTAVQRYLGTEEKPAELLKWFHSPPDKPLIVVAKSVLEALAFLACALEKLADSRPDIYAHALVFRSLEAFDEIPKNESNFVAIVASHEVEKALAGLHKKTHVIIVRTRNTPQSKADITLDLLDYETFRNALEKIGISHPEIQQLDKQSARSPTILRRLLTKIPAIQSPPWAQEQDITQALLPLIFAGAWDSSVEADREILSCLTNVPYEEVEKKVVSLQQTDEPPVWLIGNMRGVVSKIDALHVVAKLMTLDDWERFLFTVEMVLSEEDPALELPESKRWCAAWYKKTRNHSPALRKGLCDTLVLMAVRGKNLVGNRSNIHFEDRIGELIQRLLTPANAPKHSLWLSQKDDLPSYAEAAPDIFLDILEEDMKREISQISVLFKPSQTGIFGGCHRTDLLWALEVLAWNTGRLMRVTNILAAMCEWTPDDNYMNKPIESLFSIFRHWMPQTATSVQDRVLVLETLMKKFPKIGWRICVNQFKMGGDSGGYSYTPRWRKDAYNAGEVTTTDHSQTFRWRAVELALKYPKHDEHSLGDLVARLGKLMPQHRDAVWKLIRQWHATEPSDAQKVYLQDKIRRNGLNWRTHQKYDEQNRMRARELLALLESKDIVIRHQYLFLEYHVNIDFEDFAADKFDHKKIEKRVHELRHGALRKIWEQASVDGLKKLCRGSKDPSCIGWHMAEILGEIEQSIDFLQSFLSDNAEDSAEKLDPCIRSFLQNLEKKKRIRVISKLFHQMTSDESSCIRLLCCAPFDMDTWNYVDGLSQRVKQQYWQKVNACYYHDASKMYKLVDELLNVDRPRAAFHAATIKLEGLDSPRLVRLLTEVATNNAEPSDHYRLDPFNLSRALETLEKREDTRSDQLAHLEFRFIEGLENTKHGIKNLEAELSETPRLFIDVLVAASKRDGPTQDPAEQQYSEGYREAAWLLLRNAKRIPGTQPDGSIDGEKLKNWVQQARTLADECGRVEIGDDSIGQLLSHSPTDKCGLWPCKPVREVIEDFYTKQLATAICMGVYNSRGMTSRSPSDGGEQEHELAEKYRRWSKEVSLEYPSTSRILEDIASSYDHDAGREDQSRDTRKYLHD